MLNILLTGVTTLDIINQLESYPEEDTEARALSQQMRPGGNATNSAIVMQQLGVQAHLLAQRADDSSADWVFEQLALRQINVSLCPVQAHSHTPTSYISLSQTTGTRTIVHYRQLDELNESSFLALDLSPFNWLHFEIRHCLALEKMLQHASRFNAPISLELEKPRNDQELTLPFADILLVSRAYAESQQFTNAKDCLSHFAERFPHKIICCSWGRDGAWLYYQGSMHHQTAYIAQPTLDSLAAGDTFNAAFISAMAKICNNRAHLNQLPAQEIHRALDYACLLAGQKCSQHGLDTLNAKPFI